MSEMHLTTEQWVIVLTDKSLIYITQDQANRIRQSINVTSEKFLEMPGGRLIALHSIVQMAQAVEYDTTLRLQRGEWQCKQEFCKSGGWHARTEKCPTLEKKQKEAEDKMVKLVTGEFVHIDVITNDQLKEPKDREFINLNEGRYDATGNPYPAKWSKPGTTKTE